jgi:hypothetical protein
MSVMTRSKRMRKPSKSASSPAPSPRMTRETEAPDVGVGKFHREAPDSGRVKIAEAPDAGEGRAAFLDHEFTHGRSQN